MEGRRRKKWERQIGELLMSLLGFDANIVFNFLFNRKSDEENQQIYRIKKKTIQMFE